MAKDLKAKARALSWDVFNITTKGITVAVKTVQGVGFAFTSDGSIIVMCDNQGMYSPAELAGCIKQNGNFSDYDTARIISTIVTTDMDIVPLNEVKADFESALSRLSFPDAAKTEMDGVDWGEAYEELRPFIEVFQELNSTKLMTM